MGTPLTTLLGSTVRSDETQILRGGLLVDHVTILCGAKWKNVQKKNQPLRSAGPLPARGLPGLPGRRHHIVKIVMGETAGAIRVRLQIFSPQTEFVSNAHHLVAAEMDFDEFGTGKLYSVYKNRIKVEIVVFSNVDKMSKWLEVPKDRLFL